MASTPDAVTRVPDARVLILIVLLAWPAVAQDRLGLPPLPALDESARMDSMLYADRAFDGSAPESLGDGGTLVQVTLTGGITGTGKPELFYYQLPPEYDAFGEPYPIVLGYHGFGQSANSVATQSALDDEAYARGWVYMAVTGIDDALFGAPIVQQNIEAAIEYMFTNFNVDEDRLFMVGFSMGAGIVANFAARHRDPEGIVVAGVGTVAGSFDWTQTYVLDQALQPWLENEFNFGDDPFTNAFRYQQASAIYLNPQTYLPLPGTLQPELSMAANLGSFAVYMTWDVGDTLVELPLQNEQLRTLLESEEADLFVDIVSGTVDPNTQLPATHSWYVLDEVGLFDFFDGKSANRTPADVHALVDVPRVVSYFETTPRIDKLADVTASQPARGELVLDFSKAIDARVDLGVAGLGATTPLHLTATVGVSGTMTMHVGGADQPPSYLLDWNAGTLITGVDANPLVDEIIVSLPPSSTLDAQVVTEPWLTDLVFTPDPAAIGGPVTVTIDGAPGAATSFLMFGSMEVLTTIKGSFKIVVPPIVPFVGIVLPLVDGDLTIGGNVPNDPGLQGVVLPVQALLFDASNAIVDISNLQLFRIE